MRVIGLILLIAVLFVAWRITFGSQPPQVIVREIAAVPESAEVEQAAPPLPPAREPDSPPPAVTAEDCYAPKRDYNTSVPSTLSVPPGHLMVASFFRPGEPEQVSVLTAGTWRNSSGWTFGVTFDYPNCPLERVISEAQGHANRRGGNFLGVDQGFSRS
jgi:hypothetical protein